MTTTPTTTICNRCRADGFACDVKRGLSGRPCCQGCTHTEKSDR